MTNQEYVQLVLDLENESEDTLYFMWRNSVRQLKFTNQFSDDYKYMVQRHNAICEAFYTKTGYGILEDAND